MKQLICLLLSAALLAGCTARALPVPEHTPVSSAPERSDTSADSPPRAAQTASPAPQASVPSKAAPSKETSPAPSEAPETAASWELILANEDHAVGEYEPVLAEVQGVYRMDERIAGTMKQMIADAKAQGIDLLVCSAYRPYSSQERNFNNSVDRYVAQGLTRERAVEETKKLIAEPGKSEHQTGLSADIVTPSYQNLVADYENTAAAKWLAKNAPSYGFILRYPKDKTELTKISYEPWHFRYVGVEAALEITAAGLCLEEYLEDAKQAKTA